jgi:hypothetical protein
MSATQIVLLTLLAQGTENQPQSPYFAGKIPLQTQVSLHTKQIYLVRKKFSHQAICMTHSRLTLFQAPLYPNAEPLINAPPARSYRSLNDTFPALAARLHGFNTRIGHHSFEKDRK